MIHQISQSIYLEIGNSSKPQKGAVSRLRQSTNILAEPLKMLPEFGPGQAQIVTYDGIVIDGFFVRNVERHADQSDKRAVLEIR
jgi:hypothetical protein